MSTSNQQTGKLPPQAILQGRYLIVGPRGRGGMSVVYEALDTQMARRRVAIKEMSLSAIDEQERPQALARFQQEAAILEALSHPNLPRIHDAFSEEGRSYLVMDYIEGKTLYQLLREQQGQPLPVEYILRCALQLCDVLSYLHQLTPPIIFRDVKPTNIMVTPTGQVYLIDFGIARFFKEGQEHDTEYLGSRGYAAPEQHGLGQTTPRTDIYGLGATLHHCLTGKDPFHASDPFIFSPVSYANAQVPPLLSSLVQQMTAFDERARPASMLEVKQALYMITEQAGGVTSTLSHMAEAPATTVATLPGQGPPGRGMVGNAYPPDAQGIAHTTPVASLAQEATAAVRFYQPEMTHALLPRATQQPFWTFGFVLVFLASLLLTIGVSLFALGSFPPVVGGLTLLLETGLTLLFWLVSVVSYWLVERVLPRSLLALNSIVALCATVALFVLASPALQDRLSAVLSPGTPYMDIAWQVLAISLVLAGALGLGWLLRPAHALLRVVWFVLFGGAMICALLQSLNEAISVPHHLLLLVALAALIEGTVLAVHCERVNGPAQPLALKPAAR